MTDIGRDCMNESMRTDPASVDNFAASAPSIPKESRTFEKPALLVDGAECCERNHPRGGHLPSPAASELEVTRSVTMVSTAKATPTEPDIAGNTTGTAQSQLQDTTIGDPGPTPDVRAATITVEFADEVSRDLAPPEDQDARPPPHVSNGADMDQCIEATPEGTAGTVVIVYPPTPALSVSGLHHPVDEISCKPVLTTDCENTEVVEEAASRTIADPPHSQGRPHCRPPTAIDEHEDEELHLALPARVPTTPSLRAMDGQVIRRPPQDWHKAYIAKEGVVDLQLPGHGGRCSATEEAVITDSFMTSSTQPVPALIPDGPSTPPASPDSGSQDVGLASVTVSLASCSLANKSPSQQRKRPFAGATPGTGTGEESLAKRQKLCADEPAADQVDCEEELVAAEIDHRETAEQEPGEVPVDDLNPLQDDQTSVCDGDDGDDGGDDGGDDDGGDDGDDDGDDDDDDARPDVDAATSITATEDLEDPRSTTSLDDAAQVPVAADAFDAVASGPSDTSTKDAIPSPEDHGRQSDSATAVEQFAGPYTQARGVEMEERVTTASTSPTPAPSVPPPGFSAEHGRAGIAFKPLKPPMDPLAPTQNEANDEEDEDSSLEEQMVDTEHEEEAKDAQDSKALSSLESTPEPAYQDRSVDRALDPMSAPTLSNPTAAEPATTALRHEAEFHYERRATRSKARTPDPGRAPAERNLTPAPELVTKQDDAPTAHTAIASVVQLKRQTRSATVAPKAAGKSAAKNTANVAKNVAKNVARNMAKNVAKNMAKNPAKVLGKRKTRRAPAVEDELARAEVQAQAEGCVAKRLRSRGGG
ncbi:uncharacterized protein M421DRAFT_342943 [Didymella exigua CBS 183.55]|uniref:Uncharacterized protein n=1 Tax=Didymella exigua CBS 183.55 TaxID=1150837 RepID=A0A6A5RV83_9PLEO|nr:uncharacterized protein M421DRAFT_342943 [Didymella exigua CBS 183.55]KAF1931270.1 hypothetical protein M421DRAFT_342943 [Didymella exigua CBS 183.55]